MHVLDQLVLHHLLKFDPLAAPGSAPVPDHQRLYVAQVQWLPDQPIPNQLPIARDQIVTISLRPHEHQSLEFSKALKMQSARDSSLLRTTIQP
jgi:hypothetical protein